MRVASVASSLLLALTLAGCKGNSLEGRWNVSGLQGLPPGATATYEFRGGVATLVASGRIPQAGEIGLSISGPYKVEGETLMLGDVNVTIDDSKVNPAVKPLLAQYNFKDQISKGLKENNTYKVKFDSSDQVLLTTKGGTATLTRVK